MMDKIWVRLMVVAMLACAPMALAGCSDDDEDEDVTGDGDAGDGDTGDGDAPSCEDSVGVSGTPDDAACKACLCNEDEAAATACDADCWGLIVCVQTNCLGLAEEAQTVCAFSMCQEFILGADAAIAATEAATTCSSMCGGDLLDADAGM